VVDRDGNLTTRGDHRLAYDQVNRLVSADPGNPDSGYAYDGDGKRVSQTIKAVTTRYVYDVNRSLPVVIQEDGRKYVWGLDLAYAVEADGSILVYHTDGPRSVRAITDQQGRVVHAYRTDEFGIPTPRQGSQDQPFQYTGEQRDEPTGFSYLRARYYDPQIGRFLTRDPLAGSVSRPQSLKRYSYVLNNPTSLVDPSGLKGQVLQPGCIWSPFGILCPGVTLPGLRPPSRETQRQREERLCAGASLPSAGRAFGENSFGFTVLGLVRGPEIGPRGCHVNVQATFGPNFHVYFRGGEFEADSLGPLGDALTATQTLATVVASNIAAQTGAAVGGIYEWILATVDEYGDVAGMLQRRLELLEAVAREVGSGP
jgi:RHS repeat-associated protein